MYNNKACVNLKVKLWFMPKNADSQRKYTETRTINDKNYINF